MKFHSDHGQIYIPSGIDEGAALARTTHMGIGAHQDDLEILATALLAVPTRKLKWAAKP